MIDISRHIIYFDQTIGDCLTQLNEFGNERSITLCVVNENRQLIGTITDGDVRRGFINGCSVQDTVEKIMFKDFRYLKKESFNIYTVKEIKNTGVNLVPVIDDNFEIVNLIDFTFMKSYLPIEAIIMAGGRGKRLQPLTDSLPKPMLKVGDRPILEYNIDRLHSFGVSNFHISIKYLGEKIKAYFKNGADKNIHIDYIHEDKPLGTMGSVGLIKNIEHEVLLVMNSDLLTTIDYEDFYCTFLESDADMAVATTSYIVDVPYAILETQKDHIKSFKEKPTYSYQSNAGIYLIKQEVLKLVPNNQYYDATDLMEDLIKIRKKVITFPILGYWLDIGKPEDYKKAQRDINHLNL